MIIETETYDETKARLSKWHKWFAWCPVQGDGFFVWLSIIERQACGWVHNDKTPCYWKYRIRKIK